MKIARTGSWFPVAGTKVSAIDMANLIKAMRDRIGMGPAAPGTFVVFRDAHGIVRANSDRQLRAAHEAAFIVCPDGRPLYWLGRLRGAVGVRQVPGIDSVEAVCRAGLDAGWRHYFLGGGDGVAQRLAATLSDRLPGLAVAGIETPPFRDLTTDEVDAMRRRIRASGAQIVWVGLGTPKQELFMAEHAPHLPGTVAMGVGAAFDVLTGRIARAPRWLTTIGLEWLYRLIREPRRLTRRYLATLPRFIFLVLHEAVLGRLQQLAPSLRDGNS